MPRPKHKVVPDVLDGDFQATVDQYQADGWEFVQSETGYRAGLNNLFFVKDYQLGFQDAFGKAIADRTTNKADIASHYQHSPERHNQWLIPLLLALILISMWIH